MVGHLDPETVLKIVLPKIWCKTPFSGFLLKGNIPVGTMGLLESHNQKTFPRHVAYPLGGGVGRGTVVTGEIYDTWNLL